MVHRRPPVLVAYQKTPKSFLFERGPDVSFANCGLPYYIGGEIAEREKLLVTTPELLRTRFKLDVRVRSSVEAIDRAGEEGTHP